MTQGPFRGCVLMLQMGLILHGISTEYGVQFSVSVAVFGKLHKSVQKPTETVSVITLHGSQG